MLCIRAYYISSILFFCPIIFVNSQEIDTDTCVSKVNLNNWQFLVKGDTTILMDYIGSEKDIVIPASGDLGTIYVKITKKALRSAATSADKFNGTLSTSMNDVAESGIVADNSIDDEPNDTIVDYSGTFKNLKKIKAILLPTLKIKALNGAKGEDNYGIDGMYSTNEEEKKGKDGRGTDGKQGESLDVSSMFENCYSLRRVNLDSFQGKAGNGGKGGPYSDGYYPDSTTGIGGLGGNGGTGNETFPGGKGGNGYGGRGFIGGTGCGGAGGSKEVGDKNATDGKTGNKGNNINGNKSSEIRTGAVNKTAMYCPLTIKNSNRTVSVGVYDDIYKENVVLRNSDTGNQVDDIQNLSITATDEANQEVSLADLTKKAGTYAILYTYGGTSATEVLTVKKGENQATIGLKNSKITKNTGDVYGEKELRENISKLVDKDGKGCSQSYFPSTNDHDSKFCLLLAWD